MSEARDEAADAYALAEAKFGARGGEMLVELQRADGKAAALSAVAGGLLAVAGTALVALAEGSRPASVILACSCSLLGAALAAALVAIRPVLPHGALTGAAGICAQSMAEDLLAAFQAMSREDRVRVEADRLSLLAGLAHRKFRVLKVSVDLIVAAVAVAGIGLLITYVSC